MREGPARWRCVFGFHRWGWERVLLIDRYTWAYREVCQYCPTIRVE